MHADDHAGLFAAGWYRYAAHHPSPHADARPRNMPVDLLVVHAISLPAGVFEGTAIDALFLGTLDTDAHPALGDLRGLRVSSHFLIHRDGRLVQYVSCDARAWHAGESRFGHRARCNDFSIGIELEGTDQVPFEAAQYDTLAGVTQALLEAYPLRAIVGHADIAPQRKTDPGPCFDWNRLQRATGLAASAFPFMSG